MRDIIINQNEAEKIMKLLGRESDELNDLINETKIDGRIIKLLADKVEQLNNLHNKLSGQIQ